MVTLSYKSEWRVTAKTSHESEWRDLFMLNNGFIYEWTSQSIFVTFFSTWKHQWEKIQLFRFYIKIKKRLKTSQATGFLIENQNFHYTCSVNWLSRTCGSTFSRFFWGKKYQRRKIQLFCFYIKMKKRLKTSQVTGFLIENQNFHYTCSVNGPSRTCGSTFSRFFWGKKYQREKIQLFCFYIKMEKRLKTSQAVRFRFETRNSVINARYSFFVFTSKWKNALKPLRHWVFWLKTRNSIIHAQ